MIDDVEERREDGKKKEYLSKHNVTRAVSL